MKIFWSIVLLVLVVLSATGAAGTVAGDAFQDRNFVQDKQVQVLSSMQWIGSNTPENSVIFSVGLPWYYFSSYIDNRTHVDDYLDNPSEMAATINSLNNGSTSGSTGPTYVVLFALLRNSTTSYSNLYLNDPRYQLEWQSSDVDIFRFVGR